MTDSFRVDVMVATHWDTTYKDIPLATAKGFVELYRKEGIKARVKRSDAAYDFCEYQTSPEKLEEQQKLIERHNACVSIQVLLKPWAALLSKWEKIDELRKQDDPTRPF